MKKNDNTSTAKFQESSNMHKQSEKTFEEEDLIFRALFDLASDGVLVALFSNKKFTNANKKMCEMLDYTKEELLNLGIPDIHPAEHLSYVIQQIEKLSKKEVLIVQNIPLLRKDKSVFFADMTGGPFVLNGKEFLVGIFRDITERNMSEETITASEEKYRTLIDNIHDGIFIIKDGKISYANEGFAKILDYSIEELTGKGIEELVAPEDLKMVAERYARRMKGENVPNEYEFKFLKKDGITRVDVRMSVGTITYEGGLAAMGTVKDITQQKRAEQELQKKEAKLRYAQAQAHLGSWEINISTHKYSWSEEMFRIFGRDPKLGVPKFNDFEKNIHPDDSERMRYYINQSISSQTPFHYEYRIIRPDGSVHWMEGRGRPIFDYKGNMIEFAGTVQDITERKQTEEFLRKSEENFRSSLDESPLGMRIATIEGGTLYANKAVLDIYGYRNIDEMNNIPLKERYTPKTYAEYQTREERRLKGELGPSEYEISIVRKNGEIRHIHVFRKDIFWNGKKQSLVIYEDITERRKAEEKLRVTLENLRQSINVTIQVLGMASEAKDHYTAGHHKRVANLARSIAQEKGLSPDMIEGIRMAGSIHDIGKLSVPGEILSKPTKLTDLEFSLIKEHSQSGYEMLKNVESPWPLAEIVYQHHERMNGSGYPRNLKVDEILLESRILAVADVVEAMASHRPYRPSLGIDAALEEIEKNSGILYDADVVDACLRLFRKNGYQLT